MGAKHRSRTIGRSPPLCRWGRPCECWRSSGIQVRFGFLIPSFYLGVALRPEPDPGRTVGYSLFLWALEPFHSLALVTGLQHLMGLGIAVMIYAVAMPQRSATAVGLYGDTPRAARRVSLSKTSTWSWLKPCSPSWSCSPCCWTIPAAWPVVMADRTAGGATAGCAVDVRAQGLPLLMCSLRSCCCAARKVRRCRSAQGTRLGGRGHHGLWLRHAGPRVHGMVPRLDRPIHADPR